MTQQSDILILNSWGPFAVKSASGTSLAPKGMKERGLIAVLAHSYNMCCTREKLQVKLWSDRTEGQAQTSLRRALSNIRKTAPLLDLAIGSDRNSVWLMPNRWRINDARPRPDCEFLEDLRIKDSEFEDWRRDQMAQQHSAPTVCVETPRERPRELAFLIQQLGSPASKTDAIARQHLCNLLQMRLSTLGSVQIVETETDCIETSYEHAAVEIRSNLNDDFWFVMLRVLQGKHRRCLWSGHVTVPLKEPLLAASPEISSLSSRAFAAIVDTYETLHDSQSPPRLRLQKASELLFSGNPRKIGLSESLIETLPASGPAKVWRAFAVLTHALEFQRFDPALLAQSVELAEDAALESRGDATVQALASIINMKVQRDMDFGLHLAERAIALDEHNPYALNALAQVQFFKGATDCAYSTALKGQMAATGLANSHYWDMQACLAALGIGDVETALSHAHASYLAWPRCRPPLRYIVALSLLRGNLDMAQDYAKILRRLEPDFDLSKLGNPDYPVETLRHLGMIDEMSLGSIG